jgi:predicted site-specific integrase-resolvase
MKANKVIKLLQITRPTLCSYVKKGIVKVKELPNGYYEYDDDSIYKLIGVEKRDVVVYGRVSTTTQKSNLDRQINDLIQFANSRGYCVIKTYKDIASGLSFDRKEFKQLIHDVISHKIKTVIISHKDRLSRISFGMWKELFEEFNCTIIVMNEIEDDDKGIFADIISLLHCFTMKMYSKRRKRKFEIIEEDLKNEE